MIDQMMVHETVLGSILTAYSDFKRLADGETLANLFANGKDYKSKNPMFGSTSIAKAVSNMTLVFPVICSRGIDIEHSSMVCKALERNAVTMLQRLFAAHQISDERDLMAYVGKFHSNISSGVASLDDIYNALVSESTIEEVTSADIKAAKNDMNNIDYVMESSINPISLNDYVVSEGAATHKPKFVKRKNDEEGNLVIGDGISNANILKDRADYFKKQVVDSDFKKANELVPTMMTVSFKVLNKEGDKLTTYDSALIGVKAKLYPVSSSDVVNHVTDKVSGQNWLTSFFRATTRETSFLKDFVMAVDKAKSDALALSTKNPTADRMWKVLERRANDSKFRRLMLSNNNAAAISTLCVSQEEVEYLRKNKNIDLESLRVVRGLFESLNLMCICIVDESLEVAKFVYDENELMWETVSFNHLEREASDNAYKKVVNMITRVSH